MISTVELDVVVKLILAAVLGGLVGLEREWDRRPAGLRTNMLICIGVTLFGMIGTYYFKDTGDVSRIWQNILTGVGFLGAGAVLKEEQHVVGLTTAAGIWAVAAVGLAIAAGLYFIAFSAEAIILVTLFLLRRAEHYIPAAPEENAYPSIDDAP